MIEEEMLFFKVYCENYQPPLVLERSEASGKIRIYVSMDEKPNSSNADVIFGEKLKKLNYFSKRKKDSKMFTHEYVYLTLHALTEASVNLKVYFKKQLQAKDNENSSGKIPMPIFRSQTARIQHQHDAQVTLLTQDSKKRKEFMQELREIKQRRIDRCRGMHIEHEFRSKCRSIYQLFYH